MEGEPKERLLCRRDPRLARMHRRHASYSELCAASWAVAPRGHFGTLWSDVGRTVPERDWLAVVRAERDQYQEKLREMEGERDRLRAELRDALVQVEHWRTLAEYRKRVPAEQRDGTDRRREHPSTDHPRSGADRRSSLTAP